MEIQANHEELLKTYEEMAQNGILDTFQVNSLILQATTLLAIDKLHNELIKIREATEAQAVEDDEPDPFQTLNGPSYVRPPDRNPIPEDEKRLRTAKNGPGEVW